MPGILCRYVLIEKISFWGIIGILLEEDFMKKFLKAVLILVLLAFFGVLGINLYVINYASPHIYKDVSELPEKYVVIIPGAAVYKNSVSHVVRDRVEAAVSCYNAGKAQKYLVSGDHGTKEYDEVNKIKNFMIQSYNVDENLVFLDHAGFSTYETMYRARDVFCVEGAVVSTQEFHLARAVYIGRKLGLDVVGIEAPEIYSYRTSLKAWWEIRECLARVKAFFEVLFNVKPKYLGDQIPITGDASLTWK